MDEELDERMEEWMDEQAMANGPRLLNPAKQRFG